jgi:hypothetical protein
MRQLYEQALTRFAQHSNVRVLNASSQEGFVNAIADLGDAINFWLDGHYSGEETFAGGSDTPIAHELNVISGLIEGGTKVAVFIDDARLFVTEKRELPTLDRNGYPPLTHLVDWACRNRLSWWIEHDIFVAVTPRQWAVAPPLLGYRT